LKHFLRDGGMSRKGRSLGQRERRCVNRREERYDRTEERVEGREKKADETSMSSKKKKPRAKFRKAC